MKKTVFLLIGIIIFVNGSLVTGMIFSKTDKINENVKSEKSEIIEESNIEKEITVDLGNGITMDFVYINSGEFSMGSQKEVGEEDETPIHTVTITKPFYMSKYEVTQEQFEKVMGYNNSVFKGAKNPVDNVSYAQSKEFMKKIGDLTNKEYSLPTEAQWEYSCRALSTTSWFFGANEEKISEYAWIGINSNGKTHEVGTKKANKWGLYDMYGNVQEWCSDWYKSPYESKEIKDPVGPNEGDSRVIRGGAWGDISEYARSAYRNALGENEKTDAIGIRCVLNIN